MEIAPAGFIVLPLIVIAAIRKEWAVSLTLFSLPFFGLKPITFAGHLFTFPELAVMGLTINQIIRWLQAGEIRIRPHPAYPWLLGFWIVGVASVVYLAIAPTGVVVHPYNTGSLDMFVKQSSALSQNNITQLALRAFTILAVIILAVNLDQNWLRISIRWIVLSGILVGAFGVIYQITYALEMYGFAKAMVMFGFKNTRVEGLRSLGPIPRMFTTIGEPGWTSVYLLYGLAIAGVSAIISHEDGVFSQRDAVKAASLLLVLLLLTTGTTGYGGLVVLSVVLFGGFLVHSMDSLKQYLKLTMVLGGFSLLAGVTVGAFSSFDLVNIIQYQANKLQFNAGSGTLRMKYIQLSLSIFVTRPLLGIGVGSHYGASLLGTLLAETGVLGFGAFIASTVAAFRGCIGIANLNTPESTQGVELLVAGLTVLGTSFLAKSITMLMFPIFWVSLALPIVATTTVSQAE